MFNVEITIERPPEIVWAYFIKPKNWEKWWGSRLKAAQWHEGGKLEWALGASSQIKDIIPGKMVQIDGGWMSTTFTFEPKGSGKTIVRIQESLPMGGAFFTDGGASHLAQLNSSLNKLKKHIESETKQDKGGKIPTKVKQFGTLMLTIFSLMVFIGLVSLTPIGYRNSIPIAVDYLVDIVKQALHHMATGEVPGGEVIQEILWFPVTSLVIIFCAFVILAELLHEIIVNRIINRIIKRHGDGDIVSWRTFGYIVFCLILLMVAPWFLALVIWIRLWIWTQTGGL